MSVTQNSPHFPLLLFPLWALSPRRWAVWAAGTDEACSVEGARWLAEQLVEGPVHSVGLHDAPLWLRGEGTLLLLVQLGGGRREHGVAKWEARWERWWWSSRWLQEPRRSIAKGAPDLLPPPSTLLRLRGGPPPPACAWPWCLVRAHPSSSRLQPSAVTAAVVRRIGTTLPWDPLV